MKVVVAIDDSPYSEAVIEALCKRGWPADTEFKVLTVMEPLPYECECQCETFTTMAQIKRQRHAHLEHLCNKVRHQIEQHVPASIVHFEIKEGDAKHQIVTAALAWEADRILIGAHGRSVCPHNLPGSVSHYVANHAHCSVETVQKPQRTTKSEGECTAVPA